MVQGRTLKDGDFTLSENVADADSVVAEYRVPPGNRLVLRTDEPFLVQFAAQTIYTLATGDVSAGSGNDSVGISLDAGIEKPGNSVFEVQDRLLRVWGHDKSANSVDQNTAAISEGSSASSGNVVVDYAPNNTVYVHEADFNFTWASNDDIYVYHMLAEGNFWFVKAARTRSIDRLAKTFAGPFATRSFVSTDILNVDTAPRFSTEWVIDEQETLQIMLDSPEVIDWGTTVESTQLNPSGVYKIRLPIVFEPVKKQVQGGSPSGNKQTA